jgi:uncharacterized protein YndB with AHSA1/START domain
MKKYKFKVKIEAGDGGGAYVLFPYDTEQEFATNVKRDLKFEAVYPNRLEEVWHALTDSGSLADWLMENDFKPLPGHKFHFRSQSRFGLERLIPCEVLVVDEPRLLSWNWGDEGSVVTLSVGGDNRRDAADLGAYGTEGDAWTCTGVGFESWVGAQDRSAITGRARMRGIGTDAIRGSAKALKLDSSRRRRET